MTEDRTTAFLGIGAVGAALGSALCCAGPLVVAALGVSGASFAARFDFLRPWFLGSTAVLLLFGFWVLDREERMACEPGRACAEPHVRRRMKLLLWIATVVSVLFATFPRWQHLLAGG